MSGVVLPIPFITGTKIAMSALICANIASDPNRVMLIEWLELISIALSLNFCSSEINTFKFEAFTSFK
jgi:hypothetical protein